MITAQRNIEVDIHLLSQRYSHTRIKNSKVLARMQNSIMRYGQIVPAIAIPDGKKFILIDGYLRLHALMACGHDSIKLLVSEGNEADSLFSLLASNNDRHWEVIEQASLINELQIRFSYSLSEIGKQLGRDKSWVKRRLDLIISLPDEIKEAVMTGKVSTWSASHVLVPLSRVNEKDACRLTKRISEDPISTRQLSRLYDHYRKSPRTVRDRIIAEPFLFARTILQQDQDRAAKQINDGPEGKWQKDITIVCHILKRLLKTAEYVFYPSLDKFQYRQRLIWMREAETMIIELIEQARRRSHDNTDLSADNSGDGKQRRELT